MATQESEAFDGDHATLSSQMASELDKQHETSAESSRLNATEDSVPSMPPASEAQETLVSGPPDDEMISQPETQIVITQTETTQEAVQIDTDDVTKTLPESGRNDSTAEHNAGEMSDFAYSKPDRRILGLGVRRAQAPHLIPPGSGSSPRRASSPHRTGQQQASICSSPLPATGDAESASEEYPGSAPCGSVVTLTGDEMSSESHGPGPASWHDPVQYQVDEQIHHEASMSDGLESQASSESQSEDVVYMGANLPKPPMNVHPGSARGAILHQASRPIGRSDRVATQFTSSNSTNRAVSEKTSSRSLGSRFNYSSSTPLANRQPSVRVPSQPRAPVTIPAFPATDTQDLLDVVAYKFKQQQQGLQQAYSSHNKKIQSELQQACEENELLRAQVAAAEEHCAQSDVAISKYRTQIGKAKTLQKFLDGMGNDLHSLKLAFDHEKRTFATRIGISETEIARLESALAGRAEFEGMLSHSKTLLESLLEAKGFELQSALQHRDMLRAQLEEKIGQLVEERDTRSRLEQLVGELRISDRASLTASIEQCTAALLSKMSSFDQKDDQLVVDIAALQEAVQKLTERPAVTVDDFKTIKDQLRDVGLNIAQSISMEAAGSTTVTDVSTSLEGIVQYHMQTLSTALDRLESTSRQTKTDEQATAVLRGQLQSATNGLTRLEVQLDASRQSEASLNTALSQSAARISELEATAATAGTPNTDATSEQVEHKVCVSVLKLSTLLIPFQVKEAVAEAQKQLSDNANAFIAQEKSRYSNELKKIGNERSKALQKVEEQTAELERLHFELTKVRGNKAAAASGLSQQLEDITGRFHTLEDQYKTAQRELGEKRSLASRLNLTLAEHEAAKSKITQYNKDVSRLTQEVETCKAAVLKARAAEEHATTHIEEVRSNERSSVEELRRKLSQAEEKSRYAEAGLAQMKSSAEKTISEEQEKHRKQREALQQRLTQAQDELQLKADEAVDTRAFVERTVDQQQAVWQKSYAEVEAKAAECKAVLDEKCQLLDEFQAGRDATQAQLANLQAEVAQFQKSEAERQSREAVSQKIIDDLRKQHDAAHAELASLQGSEQLRFQMEGEHARREKAAQTALEELRKERDEAKDAISSLQAYEEQHKQRQAEHDARDAQIQKEMDALRSERDAAHNALRVLQAESDKERDAAQKALGALQVENNEQNRRQADRMHGSQQLLERPSGHPIVPPKIADLPAPAKQRKKADRTTNTIVRAPTVHEYNNVHQAKKDVLPSQGKTASFAQLIKPSDRDHQGMSRPVSHRTQGASGSFASQPRKLLGSDDDMLDTMSSQHHSQVIPETQSQSSLRAIPDVESSMQRGRAAPLQTFGASLDFSGNPRITNNSSFADATAVPMPSQASQNSEFKIYEDPHTSFNDEEIEDESVRANFTFRKPFPMPNSGSKRLSRTTSDRSLEDRASLSRRARNTPEIIAGTHSLQRKHTPETPKYGFGSSPEFMNPPSVKVKRRYSGPSNGGTPVPANTHRSSTPMPDPRLAAKAGLTKRKLAQDHQQTNELNQPPAKRQATPTVSKVVTKRDDESFVSRSSQSVNDLPRIDGMKQGRNTGNASSSRMRISGGTTRTTRAQGKNNKGKKKSDLKTSGSIAY